jgi:hypothetical protein
MDEKLSKSARIPTALIRIGLLAGLTACGIGIYFSVTWIYYHVNTGLGLEIAQVVVAFLAILILFLIVLGFGAGFSVDRFVLKRRNQALKIYGLLKTYCIFHFLWEYIAPLDETENTSTPDEQHTAEMKELLNRPKRRGRPPTYSIDHWQRVVLAWENRDPLHNPMTLKEFLSEKFGTYADGSPRMSENSYYDWRKKVFDDLHKQDTGGK